MTGDKVLEDPIFEDIVIFYNYVFDLGSPVSPIDVGRKILKTEYAISLSNHIKNDVELADKFNENLILRKQAVDIKEFLSHIENNNWLSAFWVILRHPKFALKYSLIFFRNLWHAYQNRQADKDNGERIIPLSKGDSDEDSSNSIDDAIRYLDMGMGDLQSLTAIQMLSDRTLFSDIYLSQLPFVRLELQSLFATINREENEFKVTLFIHRTGIAVLSLYTKFDKKLRANDLIDLQVLQDVKAQKVRIPDALIATQAIVYGAKPSFIRKALASQRKTSHQEWFEFFEFEAQEQEEYSLRDIIEWYRITVLSTVIDKEPANIKNFWKSFRSTDWFAYPIVFVREMPQECGNDEDFKSQYAPALAGLLTRYKRWKELKPSVVEKEVNKDLSITSCQSQYMTLGNALVLYYPSFKEKHEGRIPSHDWLFSHFHTSGLVDILLTQNWVLHIIDVQLQTLPYSLKKLNSLKRDLLLAISEYHDIAVSYGTAKNIVKSCQTEFGLDEVYNGIKDRLSNLEKLIDTFVLDKTI